MQVVNLFGDDWDNRRDRPCWQWNHLDVGDRAGAELFGASVYELEPGQKTFPYHWQYVEEEMLIVLDGEPTLRTPEGERRLSRGVAVVFRRGPPRRTPSPQRHRRCGAHPLAVDAFPGGDRRIPGQRKDRRLRRGAAPTRPPRGEPGLFR